MKVKSSSISSSSSSSASASAYSPRPRKQGDQCCDKAIECAVSACALSVCCPLAIVWCCIKLPCKIGWEATRHAIDSNCCVSKKRIVDSGSSSFSDLDFDCQTGQVHTNSRNSSKTRMLRRTTGRVLI